MELVAEDVFLLIMMMKVIINGWMKILTGLW